MMKKTLLAGVALALLLAPLSCKGKQSQTTAGRPLLVVAGKTISEAVFNFYMQERLRQHSGAGFTVSAESIRDAVMQDVIVQELMVLGAREKGLTVSDEEVTAHLGAIRKQQQAAEAFDKLLADAGINENDYRGILRDRILALRFGESLVHDDSVTEADVKEYYKNSPTPFLNPASYLVSFIEVTDEARAKQIRQDIDARGFMAVSSSLQNAPDVMVGGYGWASPGMFPSAEVADGLARTGKGRTGGPFAAGGAHYLFHVKDVKAERPMTIEEAGPEIRSMLLKQKRDEAIMHWVEEKKNQVEITSN